MTKKFIFETDISISCQYCGHENTTHVSQEMEIYTPLHLGCKNCKTIFMSIALGGDGEVLLKHHDSNHPHEPSYDRILNIDECEWLTPE